MPKTEIDYSNTIFYKISCKSEDNDELYIGHTTNFVQRKSAHKNSCKNPKSSSYPLKLYKTIRDCGGWDNWNMEIIAFRKCNDSREARKTEQEYYEKLGATLNSIQPLPPPKNLILAEPRNIQTNDNTIIDCDGAFKYKCDKCDFKCNKKYDYKRHISTRKRFRTNSTHKYSCDICDYSASRKSHYERHLQTARHKKLTAPNELGTDSTQIYSCHCGKEYRHLSSLCKHKKNCKIENTVNTTSTNDDKYDMLSNIIMILVKENQEFKQLMADQNEKLMEVCKTLYVT